ncbi:universal stress protein [Actinacidiphila soli]|uniref:universal stress protein n=1 Tax=Actinacidiphila soli TaxID=2487275 RepID=UPI000FCAA191|nr:universal stress protein [Actinacidiphila soli]
MEFPLVVGVDGSESGLQAVDWAVGEAARHEVPLRLVYASLWERYEGRMPSFGPGRPSERVMAEHIIASAAERAWLGNPDVKLSTDVLPEDTVSALLREGREAFALVTGHRGRGELAGALLGSVGLAVASRAQCPVIVVRGAQPNAQGTFGRVVLGVGEAGEGEAAVAFAFREAELRGGGLDAVRAWRCPARELPDFPTHQAEAADPHRREAERLLDDALRAPAREHPGVAVRRETREGTARDALLDAAVSADLLVVGARRRHGSFGMQLGPVNHAMLHHAACPVAIVPQTS